MRRRSRALWIGIAVLVLARAAPSSVTLERLATCRPSGARASGERRSVEALIQALGRPRDAVAAQSELDERPAEEVVPALLIALSRDAVFEKDPQARNLAFECLATVTSKKSDGTRTITIDAQVEALGRGLHESSEGIRYRCARGLGGVSEEHQAQVVSWLRASLHDRGRLVVEDAARSLGRIGRAAAPAMPELLALLADPSKEEKSEWDRARSEYGESLGDIEVYVRSASAEARMRIAGIGVDAARYRELDRRGQQAAVMAMKATLFRVAFAPQKELESLSEATQREVCDWCRFCLGEAKDADREARRAVVGMLCWIAASGRFADGVRASAKGAVDGAALDGDENVAAAAKTCVEELKRVEKK